MQIKKKNWLIIEPQQLKLFAIQPTFGKEPVTGVLGCDILAIAKQSRFKKRQSHYFFSLKNKLYEEDELQSAVKSFNKRGHGEKCAICTTGKKKKSKK